MRNCAGRGCEPLSPRRLSHSGGRPLCYRVPMTPAKKDHVDLICNIAELTGLFHKTASLDDFLHNAVSVIAWHMRAEVCSVYLFDETTGELVLRANQGLNRDLVGRLTIKIGEGLVGRSLQELRAIREANAPKNAFFKLIPGLNEERFRGFLAVPIRRGLDRLGVLVVQDPVEAYFNENDERALQAIAAQLSSTIESAKLLISLREKTAPPVAAAAAGAPAADLRFRRFTPGAPGVATGTATVLKSAQAGLELAAVSGDTPATLEDFRRAVARTSEQLERLHEEMEERMADVASLIFNAHLLILKDSQFVGAMDDLIAAGKAPAAAICEVTNGYVQLFDRSRSPRLREKVQDVLDLGRRLLGNLRPRPDEEPDYRRSVIVAEHLLPSDLVKLKAQNAAGLVMVGGGVTAHIAILARALALPMVIADERRYLETGRDQRLLLDGDQGTIYVNPGPEILRQYEELVASRAQALAELPGEDAAAATRDGVAIEVMANINLLSEIPLALQMHADGVGLYRSEFPFIVRDDFPSEEEQFVVYRALLEQLGGRPVVFRTLDVGGDKMLSYFPTVTEANPFLGLRALRFTLRHRDIFGPQLKALLRAGAGRELQIMFPMVSSLDEFLEAREVVASCAEELAADGLEHNASPRLGVMIELPSAVEIAGELAAQADFLSIGANDLVQYMLAVDRTNEQLSDLYVSHHPAVLRALKRITDAAAKHGKPVSICGEMAADPRMLPFLIGVGLRRFSVEVRSLRRIRAAARTVDTREAARLAGEILALGAVRDVARVMGYEATE
jgi:phosphotransferase system, enzyme I, PtsP